jgi:hypothetical protein
MNTSDSPDYFTIPTVDLRVSKTADGTGRAERYEQANHLMRRLDEIGRRQLFIVGVAEAAQPWTSAHVEVLNLYLLSQRGLRGFKRTTPVRWNTRYAWSNLREHLRIPELAVLVAV